MPNAFTNKIRQAGLLILGGLLAGGTGYGVSSITTGGTSLPDVTTGGVERVTTYVADQEFNVALVATGSSTIDYPAACVPNPLTKLSPSQNSGALTSLSLELGANLAGVWADVVFAKDCGTGTASGHVLLIKDSRSGSGTQSYLASRYAMTGATWNGSDYIKVIFTGNPTSAFTGRLRGTYEDVFGE